jgi:hypothetical protein
LAQPADADADGEAGSEEAPATSSITGARLRHTSAAPPLVK